MLAIDTSGTVHKDASVEVHAAREFVHALLRPVDQLDLMEFASDVREVVPFTNNLHQIDNGLERLRGGPATALYDTIFLASESLAGRPGRKVLVLITDGDDTVNGIDYPRAARTGAAFRSAGLQHHRCANPSRCRSGHRRRARADYAFPGDGWKALLRRVVGPGIGVSKGVEDLRTQYLLGYYPSRHSDWRISGRFRLGLRSAAKRRLFAAAPNGILSGTGESHQKLS